MPETTEKVGRKSLNAPDEVRRFDKGKVELVKLEGVVIGRATFEPGWMWSTCVSPIVGKPSCTAAHFGYQISGTMVIKMNDGIETTFNAGDVMTIPPGHEAWVEGDEPVIIVDFLGMANYAKKK